MELYSHTRNQTRTEHERERELQLQLIIYIYMYTNTYTCLISACLSLSFLLWIALHESARLNRSHSCSPNPWNWAVSMCVCFCIERRIKPRWFLLTVCKCSQTPDTICCVCVANPATGKTVFFTQKYVIYYLKSARRLNIQCSRWYKRVIFCVSLPGDC